MFIKINCLFLIQQAMGRPHFEKLSTMANVWTQQLKEKLICMIIKIITSCSPYDWTHWYFGSANLKNALMKDKLCFVGLAITAIYNIIYIQEHRWEWNYILLPVPCFSLFHTGWHQLVSLDFRVHGISSVVPPQWRRAFLPHCVLSAGGRGYSFWGFPLWDLKAGSVWAHPALTCEQVVCSSYLRLTGVR